MMQEGAGFTFPKRSLIARDLRLALFRIGLVSLCEGRFPTFLTNPRLRKPLPNSCFLRFADTVAGANASANLYSLLESGKVNGVDGCQYLRALLVALPRARTVDDYEALLPWRIAGLSI